MTLRERQFVLVMDCLSWVLEKGGSVVKVSCQRLLVIPIAIESTGQSIRTESLACDSLFLDLIELCFILTVTYILIIMFRNIA